MGRVKIMYDEYTSGNKSMDEIAEDYGVSQQRVSQLFKREGWEVKPAHRPKRSADERP